MTAKKLATYRVDGDLLKAVSARASEAGETVTDVIERAFRAYVADGAPAAPVKRPRKAAQPAPVTVTVDPKSYAPDETPRFVPEEPSSPPVAGLPAGTAVFAEPGAVPVVTAPVPQLPAVKPSIRRASDLTAPPRCPHPGTRQIGGWCAKCQATVSIGGKLPEGWVKPEGWTA